MPIILKHGKPKRYKGICSSCDCEFAYTDAETSLQPRTVLGQTVYRHVIACPECHMLVDVNAKPKYLVSDDEIEQVYHEQTK